MRISFPIAVCLALVMATLQAAESEQKSQPSIPEVRQSKPFNNIGVPEFEKMRSQKANVVLDVRTPKEFAAGHIPGAVNIDFNSADFEKKVTALDTNKTYLVHCAVGGRSAKACDKLSRQFPHLYNLEGGMKAWEKAGNRPER